MVGGWPGDIAVTVATTPGQLTLRLRGLDPVGGPLAPRRRVLEVLDGGVLEVLDGGELAGVHAEEQVARADEQSRGRDAGVRASTIDCSAPQTFTATQHGGRPR